MITVVYFDVWAIYVIMMEVMIKLVNFVKYLFKCSSFFISNYSLSPIFQRFFHFWSLSLSMLPYFFLNFFFVNTLFNENLSYFLVRILMKKIRIKKKKSQSPIEKKRL